MQSPSLCHLLLTLTLLTVQMRSQLRNFAQLSLHLQTIVLGMLVKFLMNLINLLVDLTILLVSPMQFLQKILTVNLTVTLGKGRLWQKTAIGLRSRIKRFI